MVVVGVEAAEGDVDYQSTESGREKVEDRGEGLGGGHIFVEAGREGREIEGGDVCEEGCIFRG